MVFIIKSDGERLWGTGLALFSRWQGSRHLRAPPNPRALPAQGTPSGIQEQRLFFTCRRAFSDPHSKSDAGSLAIMGGVPEPRGPQVSPGPRLASLPSPCPTAHLSVSPGVTSLAGILISEWLLEPLEETVVYLGAIFKLLFFKLRVCIINVLLGV